MKNGSNPAAGVSCAVEEKWVFFLQYRRAAQAVPVDQNYDFWKEVENKILASADNATVSVNAGEYGRMPVSVFNALRSRKNVTLKITYQGKTISITSQKAPVAAGDRIYWSLVSLSNCLGHRLAIPTIIPAQAAQTCRHRWQCWHCWQARLRW